MLAPIIPGINSHELIALAKACADHGAVSFGYTVVRLNGAIGSLFAEWLRMAMPDRAQKVLNQIASCHGGQLNDSRFGVRTRGEGQLAEQIKEMARLSRSRYYKSQKFPSLNTSLYESFRDHQLRLF
jgi:DNA repair photolyase